MAKNILTDNLSEPLNGTTSATVEIDVGTGHLTIDRLAGGEKLLASGELQYFEDKGAPARTLNSSNGRTTLAIKGPGGAAGGSWFRLPWAGCVGGAFEWQIHLNPNVQSDITAHSGGGNVKLNLAGLSLTRLVADDGGGNMDVVLPEHAANLSATAKTGGGNVSVEIGRDMTGENVVEAGSGAGNVVVSVPSGLAARVHATSGWGKVIMDPSYGMTDKGTYQSPDYESAANRVEITAKSGAGNVTVSTR